jgi:uncharacterized protein
MTDTTVGGTSVRGSTPAPQTQPASLRMLRVGGALFIFIALLIGAHLLQNTPGFGTKPALSLLLGAVLGIAFERGRFCFFCITRDYIEERNSGGMFSILAALAVGAIGYILVFGAFLSNPGTGRLPPDAHIGPVSWVLVVAGIAFGIGMALSGACISGHLYRLGQGYSRAPFALLGSLVGFGLGFFTWQSVYLSAISRAPIAWLPATFGYGGSLIIHLVILGVLALLFLRRLPAIGARSGGQITLKSIYDTLFVQRWNPLVTGSIVGLVGVFAYFRVEPLGVTSQLGSVARTTLDNAGLLADRLNGLDGFSGCATVVTQTITENGWLVIGLVLASFGVALIGNRFKPSPLTPQGGITALVGGVLMGWAAMLALGCTVGTLLSGTSAFAVSGWVFGAAVFAGIWLGIKLRLHTIA